MSRDEGPRQKLSSPGRPGLWSRDASLLYYGYGRGSRLAAREALRSWWGATIMLTETTLGNCPVISVDGDLDHSVAASLSALLAGHVTANGPCLVLDLRVCLYMDSPGLGAMPGVCQTIGERKKLVVVTAQPNIRRLIELVGLPKRANFMVCEDLSKVPCAPEGRRVSPKNSPSPGLQFPRFLRSVHPAQGVSIGLLGEGRRSPGGGKWGLRRKTGSWPPTQKRGTESRRAGYCHVQPDDNLNVCPQSKNAGMPIPQTG